ncbi:ATP-dependent metallopeptidase FtsH/Yme1/Tma family protein, partial [Methylocaldum sp.]|uniref:ATP-dependent metallopeptidase FtsH/Yme1/Tma family protein n=1 Tax=Methylocaldum sp. TaxID=1969727 RepID=UPI002D323376
MKNAITWIISAIALALLFLHFGPRMPVDPGVPYSRFISDVQEGQVKYVTIDGQMIRGMLGTGEKFTTYSPGDDHLVDDLLKNHVEIKAQPPESQSL